jgi:anti-sigma regulatory factor (Ser/Thr protein kinase)
MPSSRVDSNRIGPVLAAEISLGADARSAGAARRFLATTLISWKTPRYGEDAVLLLSELVANAALHARTQIGVRIELKPDCLHLAVTDGSPQQPTMRHYSDDATTGRGLALVSALALRWGVDANPDGTKTVWAEVGADPSRRIAIDPASAGEVGRDGAMGDQAGPSDPTIARGETATVLRAA